MQKVDTHRTEDLARQVRDQAHESKSADQKLEDLIRFIKMDRTHAAEQVHVEVKKLSEGAKSKLVEMIAEQLRGQMPPQLAKALADGKTEVLERLLQRLLNSLEQRTSKAPSADAARELASDKSTPQQALRWTQFVQKVLHIPKALVQGRAGSATPRGEGSTLLELLGSGNPAGAGLRSPKLVQRAIGDLSPGQRSALMIATFGAKLGTELMRLGMHDPLQFVQAGAMPDGRADLAKTLKMPRARLMGYLMRAELLKIGPGNNGEMGIRPEHLDALRQAGIAMLGSLTVLRILSREELSYIFKLLRRANGGFSKAVKGGRGLVKRDLIHWSRAASRGPSVILLADVGERGPRFNHMDAQELIQAWYMENLLWEQLANARRHRQEREQQERRVSRDDQERQQRDQDERDDDDPEWLYDLDAELEYDSERTDNLMCFWITDFSIDSSQPTAMRRMYVCIAPETGAIIPQHIEASLQ